MTVKLPAAPKRARIVPGFEPLRDELDEVYAALAVSYTHLTLPTSDLV